MSDLKLCPWCGKPPVSVEVMDGTRRYRCSDESCSAHRLGLIKEEWNTRAPVPSLWIPVSERLPDAETDVLWHTDRNIPSDFVGYLGKGHADTVYHGMVSCDIKDFTHWMPLPEPPKE